MEAYGLGGYRTTGDLATALWRAEKQGDILRADIPPEYSLRRYIARLDEFYASEPATLKDFPVEHSAYLLEVLLTMLDETEGRVDHFTRAEVEWIIRVHAAAPLMLPYEVYHFAFEYLSRERAASSALSLDIALAGMANVEAFSRAQDNGWLPEGRYPRYSSGRQASAQLRAARERSTGKGKDHAQG